MKILHLSTYDHGGAGKAALRLSRSLNAHGNSSTMLVLDKKSDDNTVVDCLHGKGLFEKAYFRGRNRLMQSDKILRRIKNQAISRSSFFELSRSVGLNPNYTEIFSNEKSFYEISRNHLIQEADIINIHWVSRMINYEEFFPHVMNKKIVWTLHDMTPFTGGCYYSGECKKYKDRCRECPQIENKKGYDLAADVWQKKFAAYQGQRINIVTPSRWLGECAKESALFKDFDVSVIPNGLPIDVYSTKDKSSARDRMGLPQDKFLILFGASSVTNIRKGISYLIEGFRRLKESMPEENIGLVVFGSDAKALISSAGFDVYSVGHLKGEKEIADCYNAVDLFVLPSLEDNLPNTVMESMACGTPVVAFDVGGVSDMVRDSHTGLLVAKKDSGELCSKTRFMILNRDKCRIMGENARKVAEKEYSFDSLANNYEILYKSILEKQKIPIKRGLHILQVHSVDTGGGAATIAWDLQHNLIDRGFVSWLAVGFKKIKDKNVLRTYEKTKISRWARCWLVLGRILRRGSGHIGGNILKFCCFMASFAAKRKEKKPYYGFEDFEFPESWDILNLPPKSPDILHFHCLHGGYFDIEALPWISHRVPAVMTLHDGWLLSGHCAHSINCERWKTGCGDCPDLNIHPSIWRDVTASKWMLKKELFSQCKLYIATPSEWLRSRVARSILSGGIKELRVINNGVDLSIFRQGSKDRAREILGISKNKHVILFIGNGIRRNIFKDYGTMKKAVIELSKKYGHDLLFILLGESAPVERYNGCEVRSVPFMSSTEEIVLFYQATDIYVHASRADTFPTTVLEALACGKPVVGTAIGGIPEQIKGLSLASVNDEDNLNNFSIDEATGLLVHGSDHNAMSQAIDILLENNELRDALGENAAAIAKEKYNRDVQLNIYVDWYKEILNKY